MARKLVHICLAWTLVLGCWGGILAAAACPHMGCETAATAPEHNASHGEHPSGVGHEAMTPEDHCGHGDGQTEHEAGQPAPQGLGAEAAATVGVSPGERDPFCSHCMGRPSAPPSSNFEWQSDSAGKSVRDAAPQAAPQFSAPASAHYAEVLAPQHAPPGASDRHILISVFRI